jgi:hypothetical protein
MERQLSRLRERAHQQQEADRHDGAVVRAERLACPLEDRQIVERAGLVEDQERRDHEPDVADHVDDERLDASLDRRAAPVPVGDQEVGGRADERPPDDQDHEVRRQNQQQHREDEVVQVGEIARVAAVARHVGDRVEVDQTGDAADHEAHEHR